MAVQARPDGQLLDNRGILAKINAVVRKKAKPPNTQVPPEWDPATAQSYRLLVGPAIRDYMAQGSASSSCFISRVQSAIASPLLDSGARKLRASHLHKDPKSRVQKSDISSLRFPPDLLVDPIPPPFRGNPNLLGRFRARANKAKVVRPVVNPTALDLGPPTWSSTESDSSRPPTPPAEPLLSEPPPSPTEPMIEEEEAVPVPQPPAIEVPEISSEASLRRYEVSEAVRWKVRGVMRLRTYFYVLRCWARYRRNARLKSRWMLEVHHTQVLIHFFKGWYRYVRTTLHLRSAGGRIQEVWDRHVKQRYFAFWQDGAARGINLAGSARRAYERLNHELERKCFLALRDAAYGRRVCRSDVARFFRFKPDGPFRPISDFFARKRDRLIRALHHNFAKSIPPVLKTWHAFVLRNRRDRSQIAQVQSVIRGNVFKDWLAIYRDHFHARVLNEVRRRALLVAAANACKEKEAAEKVEKTLMLQLVRDRHVLVAKLSQFDRLSQNHHEAVLRRFGMRDEITGTTNTFLRRHEELQLIDMVKNANEVEGLTRRARMGLADGFLYHLGRAVRSYDNQVIAHQFCLAFRILSEPLVERAVGYFYEKRHLRLLLAAAVKERTALHRFVGCVTLFHQHTGWQLWGKFMGLMAAQRSPGLMDTIRRRTAILQLYPYFGLTDVLPGRPPRPLKEVEQTFRDLPVVSIQKKVARERNLHIQAKQAIMRKRTLRDFFRALAAFVQSQIATREVLQLMRKKQNMRAERMVFAAFKANWKKVPLRTDQESEEKIDADIGAWFRHFFRERARLQRLVKKMPIS
jgi:hypothetical protein